MLFLTLKDEPFPVHKYDENDLLELVRSVARRDVEDRTLSELIKSQDALERLGLLWNSLDCLNRDQGIELVRNLHLELSAPGDVICLKHSPGTRSYIILRGKVILSKHVLDREQGEGVRVLGPGGEFGIPLDPDQSEDDPVEDFALYARTAPHEFQAHSAVGGMLKVPGGERVDGKAELLSVSRQDWLAVLGLSRERFAGMISKDITEREADALKDAAREVFSLEAKGRGEKHTKIAQQYLMERVPFCAELPSEQVQVMARSLELRRISVPGRIIFRRGRECYGEAYIMFTGTADQRGAQRSGDRLIKEGDLFGDEFFGAGVGDVREPKFRMATAMNRTSPCELLVLPFRECRKLQTFVAACNREKAMLVFEKYFHNMPRQTSSELSHLASFRKLSMQEKLVVTGADVSRVFFIFRGECVTIRTKKGYTKDEQRYGSGHIVGRQGLWPLPYNFVPLSHILHVHSLFGPRQHLMPDDDTYSTQILTSTSSASTTAMVVPSEAKGENLATTGRLRRYDKQWKDTVVVTTPAKVLSISRKALLSSLSTAALSGLWKYIIINQDAVLDEETSAVAGQLASEMWKPSVAKIEEQSEEIPSTEDTVGFDLDSYFAGSLPTPNTRTRKRQAGEAPSVRPIACANRRSRCRPDTSASEALTGSKFLVHIYHDDGDIPYCHVRPILATERHCTVAMHQGDGRRCREHESGSPPLFNDMVWRCQVDIDDESLKPLKQKKHIHSVGANPTTHEVSTKRKQGRTHARLGRSHREQQPWSPLLRVHLTSSTSPMLQENLSQMRESQGACRSSIRQMNQVDVNCGILNSANSKSDKALKKNDFCRINSTCLTNADVSQSSSTKGALLRDSASAMEISRTSSGTRMGTTRVTANAETERRTAQRVYTLVQLSTRQELDPSDPEATLCLRLLGSFETETEAKNRVSHLYHSILHPKLTWWPMHRLEGTNPCKQEIFSDCVYLLQKGLPVQFSSFTPGGPGSGFHDRGRHGNVGTGYDIDFPSVFKAKEQNFAVLLPSSPERFARHWRRRQWVDRSNLQHLQQQQLTGDRETKEATWTRTSAVQVSQNMHTAQLHHINPENLENSELSLEARECPQMTVGSANPEGVLAGCGHRLNEVLDTMGINSFSEDESFCRQNFKVRAKREPEADENRRAHNGGSDTQQTGLGGADGDAPYVVATAKHPMGSGGTPTMSSSLPNRSPLGLEDNEEDGKESRSFFYSEDGAERTLAGSTKCWNAVGIPDLDVGTNSHMSWIVRGLSLFHKVEGCYETEARAYRKAVHILDGLEAATGGTHASLMLPLCGPDGPQRRQRHHACVIPLYCWLSLGKSSVHGSEQANIGFSVADFARARRTGFDPEVIWESERMRAVRSNFHNMLRAVGPREICNRCSRGLGNTGKQRQTFLSGRVQGGSSEDWFEDALLDSVPCIPQDQGIAAENSSTTGVVRQGAWKGTTWSSKAMREALHMKRKAIHAARDAVLTQNQKLIRMEENTRQYFHGSTDDACSTGRAKFSRWCTQDPAISISISNANANQLLHGKVQDGISLGESTVVVSRREQKATPGIDSISISGSPVHSGAVSRRGEGCSRQALRVHMTIERKRAQLFENIQMLPCINTKDAHAVEQKQQSNISVGNNGPNLVLRAAEIRSQARLHGKPAVSFLKARMGTPGTVLSAQVLPHSTPKLVPGEKQDQAATTCIPSRMSSAPMTTSIPASAAPDATDVVMIEERSVAQVSAHCATESNSVGASIISLNEGDEGFAGETTTTTKASSLGTAGLASMGGDGSANVCSVVTKSSQKDVVKPRSGGFLAASVRRECTAKTGDGSRSNLAISCDLDGELLLLDGVLHDQRVKTWVETSLGTRQKNEL